ncbi:YtxH domain-containing protein [Atopobacter phocae]|uniref:YtxH domain-containing protein n=1 Tax=Atopobacter phocae TaxID=136492 RepID=UPI00046EC42F|nr:YtxH domain-containing protein [Atopobacter phocae]
MLKQFMKGIIFGSLSGSIIALLLNPNDGETNRKQLKEKLDELSGDVQEVTNSTKQLTQSLEQLQNEGLRGVKDFTEEVQYKALNFEKEIEPRIQRIQEAIMRLKGNVEEATEKIASSDKS